MAEREWCGWVGRCATCGFCDRGAHGWWRRFGTPTPHLTSPLGGGRDELGKGWGMGAEVGVVGCRLPMVVGCGSGVERKVVVRVGSCLRRNDGGGAGMTEEGRGMTGRGSGSGGEGVGMAGRGAGMGGGAQGCVWGGGGGVRGRRWLVGFRRLRRRGMGRARVRRLAIRRGRAFARRRRARRSGGPRRRLCCSLRLRRRAR